MNFISSIAWVPRGSAKEKPDEVKLNAEQLKELFSEQSSGQAPKEADESEDEELDSKLEGDRKSGIKTDDIEGWETEGEDEETKGSGFAVSSLSVFPTNDDDPYVKVKDDEDVDSEDEDFKILPGDNLIAVAHVDEDANVLEVYVYNEENDDLYVHHDMILPSYPLALEYLSYQPGGTEEKGNYVAIGSMEKNIQIWDLDVVNALEPTYELKSRSKKRKAEQGEQSGPRGHSDAILCLAWNTLLPHILASGSADQTVVLWDLDSGTPSTVLKGFGDKVQAVKWRPGHAEEILGGSCDGLIKLFNCRYKKAQVTDWKIDGEVERLLWSPVHDNYFYVSDNVGNLYWFDVRQTGSFLTSIHAHGKAVTGLTCSIHVPGLLVTASEDKRIKVWDVTEASEDHVITEVFERKLKMGELQFASISPDSPFKLAVAGDESDSIFRILDLLKMSPEIQKHFESRIAQEETAKIEKVASGAGVALERSTKVPNASHSPAAHRKKERRKGKGSSVIKGQRSVKSGQVRKHK